MVKDSILADLLQLLGVLLLGLTIVFTLLGGVGTVCVALAAEFFGGSMASLAPFKWVYQLLVVTSLLSGFWGIWALVGLVRGTRTAYRNTLIALLAGGVAALVQMLASRALRGSSMPTDIRFDINLATLVLFLIFRLPGIWQGVNFEQEAKISGGLGPAGGLTACVTGLLLLTVPNWAGPTHTWGGVNYADAWHLPVSLGGGALVVGSIVWLIWLVIRRRSAFRQELAALEPTQG